MILKNPKMWDGLCDGSDCGKVRVILMFSNYEIENYESILDLEGICDSKVRAIKKMKSEKKVFFETQEFFFDIRKENQE